MKNKTILTIEDKPAHFTCAQMQCCKCPLKDDEEACMAVKHLDDELVMACDYYNKKIEEEGVRHYNQKKQALFNKRTWSCEEKLFLGERKWGQLSTDSDLYFSNYEKDE